MISLNLTPNDFNPQPIGCPVTVVGVDNHTDYFNEIVKTIDIFNAEIQWDEMYNFDQAIKRILDGSVLYLLFDGKILYGYLWMRPQHNGYYLHNLFMRSQGVEKKWRGREFVSAVVKEHYSNQSIYVDVDEWNQKSIRLFKSLGFK